MEITNTQPIQSNSSLSATKPQSTANLASDFETFLKMLTAQARYQDPLEPIDSSEYAAQLAQFSMVEQQVLSNDLLTGLGDQIGANTIGQMAALIGMEARSYSAAAFSGQPLTVLPKVEPNADEAVLIAYNDQGAEVARRQIATTGAPVEWDGKLGDGSVLPHGNYSFKVESRALGNIVGTSPAETYARITEARRNGSETVFVLDSGETVTSADVSGLREARF